MRFLNASYVDFHNASAETRRSLLLSLLARDDHAYVSPESLDNAQDRRMSAAMLSQFMAPSAAALNEPSQNEPQPQSQPQNESQSQPQSQPQNESQSQSQSQGSVPLPAPTHSQHLIRTPSFRTKQVIDTTQFGRMFQLFHLLSVPNILLILRVLLIERSVLLLSTQLSILTNTAESLKELL